MYLICRISNQISDTLFQLKQNSIDAYGLELMNCVPILSNLNQLRQLINKYDYVILNSPTCIDLCKDILKLSNSNIKFGCMGEQSGIRLGSVLKSADIFYPKNHTGVAGLIKECLEKINFIDKKVLFLRSQSSSTLLNEYFKIRCVDFFELLVYKYVNVDVNLEDFSRLINSNLEAIVITSKNLVHRLFDLAKQCGLVDRLVAQNFITIHPNIVQVLYNYGVKNVCLHKSKNYIGI